MRSRKRGAVDIDPIAARQWRRRPPPPLADRAIAIAITKIKPATARRRRRPRIAPHPARRASSPRGCAPRARMQCNLIQTGALCAARSTRGAGAPPGRLARAEIQSEQVNGGPFLLIVQCGDTTSSVRCASSHAARASRARGFPARVVNRAMRWCKRGAVDIDPISQRRRRRRPPPAAAKT